MTSETMRAAVYRGKNEMRLERLPVPQLGPGEALVRIDSCGVCGTDIKKIQYGLVEPPRVFGHEMAGTIVSLGEGVTDWAVGERVAVMHHVPCMDCYYCQHRTYAQCPIYKRTGTTAGFEPAGGGYAEYIRVMDWVVKRGMVRIPDGVSFEEATFVEPVNTVLKAVEKAALQPEQSALVVGQGQIGLLFTQILRARGVNVFASDPLAYRRDRALRFGAKDAFDPAADAVPAEVKTRTGGRGADLAVVAVASNAVVAQAFEAVRPGGKVLLFAQTRLGDPLEVDAGAVCMLEKDLIGSYSADIDLQDASAELVYSRKINVRDLISHRFPLEEIESAIQMAVTPRENSLKIMVTI
jgi:L-iditol 2-dehydrogenase